MTGSTRLVEVRTKIQKENDLAARALRQQFHDNGVVIVSLVFSPGSGKTMFLEQTLRRMRERYRVAGIRFGDGRVDRTAGETDRLERFTVGSQIERLHQSLKRKRSVMPNSSLTLQALMQAPPSKFAIQSS